MYALRMSTGGCDKPKALNSLKHVVKFQVTVCYVRNLLSKYIDVSCLKAFIYNWRAVYVYTFLQFLMYSWKIAHLMHFSVSNPYKRSCAILFFVLWRGTVLGISIVVKILRNRHRFLRHYWLIKYDSTYTYYFLFWHVTRL